MHHQHDLSVRFGSKADMCSAIRHVRFTPNSDIDCVWFVVITKTSHRAMARMISAIGMAVGYLAFSLPAAADVAAWCAVINYGEYWDCQYRPFEECRPNALAKRGWCNPSPYFASSPTEYRRPKKSRTHAQ